MLKRGGGVLATFDCQNYRTLMYVYWQDSVDQLKTADLLL